MHICHHLVVHSRTLSHRNQVRDLTEVVLYTFPVKSNNLLYFVSLRNFGVGLSSFMARIGGAGSTFVVYLAAVHTSVPFFVFSGMCFVAAILAFLLPETGHQPLPTSIKEIEDRDK